MEQQSYTQNAFSACDASAASDLGAAGVRSEVLELFPLPWNRVDGGV